jgi:hypothetical protein
VSVILALQQYVPRSAMRRSARWLYAGDNPAFELRGIERVSTADMTASLAQRLRDPYLEAIGQLSVRNASTEWWASHLAAKHPYPSLFARLCGLAAARELATDGTLVICSTPAQLRELELALPAARTSGSVLGKLRHQLPAVAVKAGWPALRRLGQLSPVKLTGPIEVSPLGFTLSRVPAHRRRTLQALGAERLEAFTGEGSALLVTWIDQRSFTPEKEFRDPHLGPLGPMLRQRGLRVSYLAKPLLHAPFASCMRSLTSTGEPCVFPDLYLSDADWRDCARRVAAWRPSIPESLAVDGIPLARLAREYFEEHRRAQVDALSHEVLVRNLARAGVAPELVIFPWEGHAWEHVLIEAVHRYMPQTRVVAYDNLNFSSLALSLFPSPLELEARPLPDRVVTNGTTFAEVLGSSAFPADRIVVGCALRHTHLAFNANRRSRAERFILAAGSIDANQTIELLRKAATAFGDQVLARLHPASNVRAIKAAVPATMRFAQEPLTELLPHAKLMLYTYSVVPYEALAAGTPPVFVRSETMLDLDQLDPTPDVRWVARTVGELRAVAREIGALRDRSVWELRAREVALAALAPVGSGCVDCFL